MGDPTIWEPDGSSIELDLDLVDVDLDVDLVDVDLPAVFLFFGLRQ